MFNIKFLETVIGIDNRYPYIENFCSGYITDDSANIVFYADDKDLNFEDSPPGYDKGYLESLAIYRKIAEHFIDLDGFLLHCALISVNDRGIAFAARSGVGKSTHIMLWKKLLGNNSEIINGDKPLVRFFNDIPYGCGTPWAGKEGLNTNKSVRIHDICFLERSENNYIKPLDKGEAAKKLFLQVYMPKDSKRILKTMGNIDKLIKNVNVYTVGCNMDISAAKTVYDKIFGDKKYED